MNPFNQSNAINPNFKSVYEALTKSSNPMQVLSSLAYANPSLQPIVNALNSGQNPQDLFYQLCSSRGVNPQDILNQLK